MTKQYSLLHLIASYLVIIFCGHPKRQWPAVLNIAMGEAAARRPWRKNNSYVLD
jgi:integral membrane sensor domain MASE1